MKLFLIFDYIDIDLKKYIEEQIPKEKFMDPNDIKLFLYQILEGVKYCHAQKILHRDLKPQNILISSKGIVKLADFGLARVFSIPIRPYTKEVLTLWYRAPEILLGIEEYSEYVDLWAIGCIFAELATKKPLFSGENETDQLIKIFSIMGTPNVSTFSDLKMSISGCIENFSKYPPADLRKLIPQLDSDGINLLQRFLEYNPFKRISAVDALNHPYFKSILH